MTEGANQVGLPRIGVQAWVAAKRQPSPAPHRLQPVTNLDRNYDWVKPRNGGFWTSTWDADYGSGWIDWCIGESFAGPEFNVWLLTPDPAARIYEIDTYDDLRALVRRFPGRDPLPGGAREYPNWAAVAEVYDGVHLTDEGQWATRMSSPENLYGWDCECVLWFRWSFTDVALHGTWTAPSVPCTDGDNCWRTHDAGRHVLSRRDREEISA